MSDRERLTTAALSRQGNQLCVAWRIGIAPVDCHGKRVGLPRIYNSSRQGRDAVFVDRRHGVQRDRRVDVVDRDVLSAG